MTKPQRSRVLVAGSTGYLGRHVVAELLQRGCPVSALARDVSKAAGIPKDILVEGDVLHPETLTGACAGVDVVISCLGNSTAAGQTAGDAFRPVGEGNLNLFRAAAAAGARRFIMTGSCNSRAHRHEYEGFESREAAVDTIVEECTAAGCSISYTVIDPSMFFKDADRMFGAMVRRGTASALGDGFNRRFNPIHGADLASRMVDSMEREEERNSRIAVGGPDILTLRNISVLAAGAAGVLRPRYRVAPLWLVRIMVLLLGVLGGVWPSALRYRSFARFLLVVSQYDAIGERCGRHRMVDYMQELAEKRRDGDGAAQIERSPGVEGDSKKIK